MKKKLLSRACIIAILLTNTATLSIAAITFSETYRVNDNTKIISRIRPQTTIETFKSNTSEQLTVYKDETKSEEMKVGLVGTGMLVVKDATGEEYTLSVIGDLNGDGKATQVELTNIIRHIVGLEGAELTGIKYESADITGDKKVDQRDITRIIKYIVTGRLDINNNDEETGPIVELTIKEEKTDSIKLETIVRDLNLEKISNATITVYVKKAGEPDTSYNKRYTGTNNELVIDGLEAGTDYEIKVEAKDENGYVGSNTITASTISVPDNTQTGAITFGSVTWSNGRAKVTINTNTNYTIEYQVNGTTGSWIKGPTGVSSGTQVIVNNLNHNDVVYARLTDGANTGNSSSITITDATVPTINLTLSNVTTNSVTATATASDNESGVSSSATYKFSIKKTSEPDSSYVVKQNTTATTCMIEGLEQNVNYTVKVEVADVAGNIGTKTETASTTSVPNNTQVGAITFGSVTWNSGKAKVTISTDTSYTIEYQINGTTEGGWTKGPTGVTGGTNVTLDNLNHNDIVYARLTDGANAGNSSSITITDKVVPTVNLTLSNVTTSSLIATATASDNESGISASATYKFSIKKTSEPDSSYAVKQNATATTCMLEGLEQNTSYTVKVEVADVAGNIGAKTETASTTSVPSNTQIGAITFGSVTWTSGKAKVTVSTNTSYTIEYQINGTIGSWTKGPTGATGGTNVTVENLNHNDVVYARLTDGVNVGNNSSITITDAVVPTVNLTLSNVTTNSLTATASAIDNESEIATDTTYKFSIKKTSQADSSYVVKQNTTSKTCTITGLEQNVNYTVKVEVADAAGNTGTKTTTTSTTSVPNKTQSGAITFGSVTWNSGKAKVTISTNTSYMIEYQVNSTSGTWTRANSGTISVTVSNLNNTDVVYARLTDGVNVGNNASVTVADATAPTVSLTLSNVTTNSVMATASATDSESGISAGATYKFSIKKTSEPDSSYVEKQNTTSNTCTITGIEQGTNYAVKVEVADTAGNTGTRTATTTTTSMPDKNALGAVTFGTVSWSGGKASIPVTTNTSYKIQYQVNGINSGSWTNTGATSTTVSNLNSGDVVYARLTDGTNTGSYVSLGITNATSNVILKDYQAYSNGKLVTGTMENYAGKTVTASTVKQNGTNAEITIPSAGYYGTDSQIAIPLETLKKNIPSLSAASQVTPSDLTQLTQTSSNSWTASANGLVMVAVTAKCTNWGSVSSNDATYANYYIQKNGVDQNLVGFCAFNTNVNYTSKYTGFKVNAGDTFTIRRKTASEEINPDAVSAGYYTSSWNASMQIFFAY